MTFALYLCIEINVLKLKHFKSEFMPIYGMHLWYVHYNQNILGGPQISENSIHNDINSE